MTLTTRACLLALNSWPGLGPARFRKLRQAAGGVGTLAAELPRHWPLLGGACGPFPGDNALQSLADHQERALEVHHASLLHAEAERWPREMEELTHPPPLLFVQGDPQVLNDGALRVGVVGARACTPYGREQAARFGAGLAAHGATVVSGAARGIDSCAMDGAVSAAGRVVAVLGCGLDRPYPPDAQPILQRLLAQGGAVVSEFPFGMAPQAGNFPRRNRILAALGRALVVVQATRRSGSMNTVAWALSLGREVYAVPGPVDCAASQGPHLLLRDGAALAEGPLDVLRDAAGRPCEEERGREPRVLTELARADASLARLAEALGEPEDSVLLELVELEMRGRVVRGPGGLYHRCGPARSAADPPA